MARPISLSLRLGGPLWGPPFLHLFGRDVVSWNGHLPRDTLFIGVLIELPSAWVPVSCKILHPSHDMERVRLGTYRPRVFGVEMSCPDSPPGGAEALGEVVAGAGVPRTAGAAVGAYPQWPVRIIELARAWKGAGSAGARQTLLGELWLLLNGALLRFLEPAAAGRPFFVDPEVRRDIASEKALGLVRKLESGEWDPGASPPGQLFAFLGVVARNGLADYERTSAAERRRAERIERDADEPDRWMHPHPEEPSPETAAWRERFAGGLLECLRALTPRLQVIWFLKVFYELGSRDVGRHPELNMKPGAVDVAWGRCRRQVQACLEARGFSTRVLPVGTFTTLWQVFRVEWKLEV